MRDHKLINHNSLKKRAFTHNSHHITRTFTFMNETCSIKQFEEKNKKEIYTNEKVREIGIIFPSTINFSCSRCYSSHIDINKKLQQQQYEVLEH